MIFENNLLKNEIFFYPFFKMFSFTLYKIYLIGEDLLKELITEKNQHVIIETLRGIIRTRKYATRT